MKDNNICKFIPVRNSNDTINAINFVYERKGKNRNKFTITSVFIMYIVIKGSGFLHTIQGDYELKYGDLFFTFPANQFSIEKKDDLQYIYISFLGLGASKILDRLKISNSNPVHRGYDCLVDFWKSSINLSTGNNVDLLAESILLYTFAHINSAVEETSSISSSTEIILKVKKHIDDNYFDTKLSLEGIGKIFSYNAKYLSNLFKKSIGVGFTDYLQTIRIQHACELMQQGLTAIKNVAYLSGYNDPLYFSRVFKEKMGVSPKAHIESLNEK